MNNHSLNSLGTTEDILRSFPDLNYYTNYEKNYIQWFYKHINLTECPQDCSTLLLNNTLLVTKQHLKWIIKFCKKYGYNTIFCSLVGGPIHQKWIDNQLSLFKKFKFKLVGHIKSSKTISHYKYVLIKNLKKTTQGYINL